MMRCLVMVYLAGPALGLLHTLYDPKHRSSEVVSEFPKKNTFSSEEFYTRPSTEKTRSHSHTYERPARDFTTDKRRCGKNERYNKCGTSCPDTCEDYTEFKYCQMKCNFGCFCEEGYARDKHWNCVSYSECNKQTGKSKDDNDKKDKHTRELFEEYIRKFNKHYSSDEYKQAYIRFKEYLQSSNYQGENSAKKLPGYEYLVYIIKKIAKEKKPRELFDQYIRKTKKRYSSTAEYEAAFSRFNEYLQMYHHGDNSAKKSPGSEFASFIEKKIGEDKKPRDQFEEFIKTNHKRYTAEEYEAAFRRFKEYLEINYEGDNFAKKIPGTEFLDFIKKKLAEDKKSRDKFEEYISKYHKHYTQEEYEIAFKRFKEYLQMYQGDNSAKSSLGSEIAQFLKNKNNEDKKARKLFEEYTRTYHKQYSPEEYEEAFKRFKEYLHIYHQGDNSVQKFSELGFSKFMLKKAVAVNKKNTN